MAKGQCELAGSNILKLYTGLDGVESELHNNERFVFLVTCRCHMLYRRVTIRPSIGIQVVRNMRELRRYLRFGCRWGYRSGVDHQAEDRLLQGYLSKIVRFQQELEVCSPAFTPPKVVWEVAQPAVKR